MYHHKSIYHRDKPLTQEEIMDMIPPGKFIAIFGTSHTKGCCELNDKKVTHIDREYIWPHLVSEGSGIKYVNFAVPGNENFRIEQQILDFFELPGAKENCVMVIVEARCGDISGRFSVDLFADNIHPKQLTGGILGAGYYACWLDRILMGFVPKERDRNKIAEVLITANQDWDIDTVPESAIDDLLQIIEVHSKSALISSEKAILDLLSIRTMRGLVEAHGIDFKYFIWDTMKLSSTDTFQTIRNHIMKTYDLDRSIISTLSPNCHESAIKELGDYLWNTELVCDCGHRNHVGHQWVANKILEELDK